MSRNRIQKLLHEASVRGAQAVLLSSRENMRYFTGYTGEGYAVISAQVRRIVTDSRYTEQAENQARGFSVADIGPRSHVEVVFDTLREAGCKTVGFEDQVMPVSMYLKLVESEMAFTGIANLGERIRAVKDEHEIDTIRRAARLTDEGFEHILDFIKPGVAEYEIRTEMDYFFARKGARPAFDMIVASGPNGSMPHAETSHRKISAGDMITLDFGAAIDGYLSDMTRTVAVGQPDAALRIVYGIVLEAQQAAEDAAKAGMTCKEVDAVARKIIEKAGYGEFFGHGLGHGVGLQIHEQPRLSMKSGNETLEKNMIVTIEPGIYLPGSGGVRIENTCLILEEGCESLFQSTKELIIL